MKGVPLTEELYNYIIDNFTDRDELLDELVNYSEQNEIPLIQVAPEQGKFLYLLCKICDAKNALEIGTLSGYSGIFIARALPDNGKLITVDLIEKHSESAKMFFEKAGLNDKVEVVTASGLDYMKNLKDSGKTFDFIFVDANKDMYPEYFLAAMELSHTGTVLVFDNTLRSGRIVEEAGDDVYLKCTQILNEMVAKDERIESLLIPIGDGFTIGRVTR